MISLDKLRKRSGLVIAAIGLALLAFLLGDLMNSGTSLLSGSQGILGEINDEVIDYREFETEAQNIDRIFNGQQDRNGLRDNLWLDKVNEVVMGEQYEDIGLMVSPEELAGLTFGYKSAEMSSTAKQFFGATNQDVSPEQLAAVIQQIHDTDPLRWMYFEKIILKERLSQKYSNLVRQGLIASNLDAQAYYNNQGAQTSGRYVFKPFDTEIELTESEVEAYYRENKELYPQNESREVTLAIFDILPTKSDKEEIKNNLQSLIQDKEVYNKTTKNKETIKGFKNTTDVEAFVDTHSDAAFDPTFYADGQLSPAIESVMRNAEEGFVYGPYEEDNKFKLARLNARISDSVQVAIIEIAIEASEETANEIYAQASEIALARDLGSFETIADEKNIALTAATIQESDRTVSGVGEARNLVFWAYNNNTTINTVKLDDQNSRIIVAMLTNITEEGTQSLDDVRFQVEAAVKREKSAETLKEEFNKSLSSISNIDELAKAMNLVPESASLLSFSSNSIPGGFEPNVVGAFYGTEQGQVSNPVVGNSGVYVVSTEAIKESAAPKDYTALKKQLESQLQPRANTEVYSALKELAEIEDNRSKFY
tara:strand:+ start:735 stop:2522 length:1788 start_codon:yes stop_codon:yes gene_type:complete